MAKEYFHPSYGIFTLWGIFRSYRLFVFTDFSAINIFILLIFSHNYAIMDTVLSLFFL